MCEDGPAFASIRATLLTNRSECHRQQVRVHAPPVPRSFSPILSPTRRSTRSRARGPNPSVEPAAQLAQGMTVPQRCPTYIRFSEAGCWQNGADPRTDMRAADWAPCGIRIGSPTPEPSLSWWRARAVPRIRQDSSNAGGRPCPSGKRDEGTTRELGRWCIYKVGELGDGDRLGR